MSIVFGHFILLTFEKKNSWQSLSVVLVSPWTTEWVSASEETTTTYFYQNILISNEYKDIFQLPD